MSSEFSSMNRLCITYQTRVYTSTHAGRHVCTCKSLIEARSYILSVFYSREWLNLFRTEEYKSNRGKPWFQVCLTLKSTEPSLSSASLSASLCTRAYLILLPAVPLDRAISVLSGNTSWPPATGSHRGPSVPTTKAISIAPYPHSLNSAVLMLQNSCSSGGNTQPAY